MPLASRCRLVPRVAMILKPIASSWRTGATMRSLSASLTETNTVPSHRQDLTGAELALAEGHGEVAVDAHDLAGRAHLRPEHRVDAGEAREREHRLLDRDVVELGASSELEVGEALAGHDLGGDRGDGLADHLGDERHGAARRAG